MSLSPSFACAVFEKTMLLFIFHRKAFMLMQPLLKTICCRFNGVLKTTITINHVEGRQGERKKFRAKPC